MLVRTLILLSCLFVLVGCASNYEPLPEIVDAMPSEVILPPAVKPTKTITAVARTVQRQWLPPSYLEDKTRWQGIVIHHSARPYGCAAHEHKYHQSIGWDGLGYQFVINNGIFRNGYGKPDGFVEVGYRWREQRTGSHCRANGDRGNYWNKHTVGICLIGNFNETQLTERQWNSLVKLVSFLQNRYNIPSDQIKGHRDIKPTDCPGSSFSFFELRRRLARYKRSR